MSATQIIEDLGAKRQKYLDGLDANKDDINIDEIFSDFYPDQAHFIYELLQNAEDARATRATFALTRDGCSFEHDGKRSFTESDVRAITGIHNSNKSKRPDQIGQFGVGFKSVFVYTLTPVVRSGEFAFKITRLVMPKCIDGVAINGNRTRFELPFNSPKRTAQKAYAEVEAGLNALAETTLLFLSNIESIRWQIGDSISGEVLRVPHSTYHFEVRKEINGRTAASSHFLRFTQPVEGLETQNVAIAFALDCRPNVGAFVPGMPLEKQFKIVPANPPRVAVFFPAERAVSGLRFHLHAPFVPELSRASIKDTPVNAPLYLQLAKLAAQSLHQIRTLNLLTPEFLAVLPNATDNFSKESQTKEYQPIRDAILKEMNERALTPARDGTFAPARELIHAKPEVKPELQDFLSKADLKLLLGKPDHGQEWNWTVDFGTGRQCQFLESLAIRKYGINDFQQQLITEFQPRFTPTRNAPNPLFAQWLSEQDLSWHQKLYAVLDQAPTTSDGSDPLAELPITRLADGNYSKGGDCYFSSASVEIPKQSKIKIVDKQVYSSGNELWLQNRAKKFLNRIGVAEIQEKDVIKCDLKERYSDPDNPPDDAIYCEDFLRFMQYLKKNPLEVELFSETYVFKNNREEWVMPTDVYLDDPYETTLLKAYFDCLGSENIVRFKSAFIVRTPLSKSYDNPAIPREKFIPFAKAIGVQSHLEIVPSKCQNNPKWSTHLAFAKGRLSDEGHEQDFDIPYLWCLIDHPSLAKSKLIWQTMRNRASAHSGKDG